MRLILKAKKLPAGTISYWADGTVVKKTADGKWKRVKEGRVNREDRGADDRAEQYLDHAMYETGEAGFEMSMILMQDLNIASFGDLKQAIEGKPSNEASRIFKTVKDKMDKVPIPPGEKNKAVDALGKTIIWLRDRYSTGKTKLMVKVEGKTTGRKYAYKEKPKKVTGSANKEAKAIMGEWKSPAKLPTTEQVKAMVKKGNAKLLAGKIDPKAKWEVYQKLNDHVVPFREEEKGITIKMRQAKMVNKRTRSMSVVEITVPYKHASAFLKKHLKSARTRNELERQMKRSKGYKRVIQEAA